MDRQALPWHRTLRGRRCRAYGGDGVDWGRCELIEDHWGHLHALHRGLIVLRFGPGYIRLEWASEAS